MCNLHEEKLVEDDVDSLDEEKRKIHIIIYR
jgi:hypothetical protein